MADFSVGVLGLDTLGSALIRRLDAVGIGNTGTDINSRLLQAHLAGGGSAPAGSPYDLAQVCNLILLAETNDETSRESVLGPIGIVHALRPGTIIVDMSDTSPQSGPALARALYAKGRDLDRSNAGRQHRRRAVGKLTLLTAGPADALERIAYVLHACRGKNSTPWRPRHRPARQGARSGLGACRSRCIPRCSSSQKGRPRSGRYS